MDWTLIPPINMMILLFLFFVFVILKWLQYYINFVTKKVACAHTSQSYLNPELKYQNTI